ncbi:MAG: hypothetical protein Q9168_005225 [Polycauliona sp. 1 TL-2023]
MNVIAAIILPLDDEALRRKLEHEKDATIFIKPTRRNLIRDAANDGFEIEFMRLFGSDHISFFKGATVGHSYKETVVSDITRDADFFFLGMSPPSPAAIVGYHPWQKADNTDVVAMTAKVREQTANKLVRLADWFPSMFECLGGKDTNLRNLEEHAEELL